MDLFVINRYETQEEMKTEKSYDHLSELMKKIEERKKLRDNNGKINIEIDNNNLEDGETRGESSKKAHRKAKKRKRLNIAVQNLIPSNIDNLNDTIIDDEDLGGKLGINIPDGNVKRTKLNATTTDNLNSTKQEENFMVLGHTSYIKKEIVKRVLPKWLIQPKIISADLQRGPELEYLTGKLDNQLIEILRNNGINKLFPVQEKLINWMLKCSKDRSNGWWARDTCVSAPTGSGKTLAYVLPIIQHLKHRLVREIRCLIVLPVQELAAQVYKVIITYSAYTDLRASFISSATPIEIQQANLLKKTNNGKFTSRVDILIATPGRLIDHIEKTEGFSLANLEFLIIDEADRATDWLKYIPDPHRCPPPLTIKNLYTHSIAPAQKLLFSATLSQDPEKLSRLGLFHPILFTSVSVTDCTDEDVDLDKQAGEFIGKYTSPPELIERAFESLPEYKPIVLWKLITSKEIIEKALIFTNSSESTHRLSILLKSFFDQLNLNIGVDELSAQLTPKQRREVLKTFITGDNKILVSSDALARGLDIHDIKLVVSYDLPKYVKGYIHRIGRTGRAGVSGTAVSILTPNQIAPFNRMLSSAHKVVPTIEHLESVESIAEQMNYQSHLDKLKRTIENEKTNDKRIRIVKKRQIKFTKVNKSNVKNENKITSNPL